MKSTGTEILKSFGALNDQFYPTPEHLIARMWGKVKNKHLISNILEPHAGMGHILKYIKNKVKYKHYGYCYSCIELDPNLRSILIGKQYRVIDSDFLTYSGYDCFDLIIANPPFKDGDKHLLKAMDIMDSGEIVFLLNAETLKNPCTHTRKMLMDRLSGINADIEYIENGFADAERKTGVDVAIVHIEMEKFSEEDLLKDSTEKTGERVIDIDPEEEKNPAPRNSIEFLVAEYEDRIQAAFGVLEQFYKNVPKVDEFLFVGNVGKGETYSWHLPIPHEVINTFLEQIRVRYWKKILDLPDVKSRMTAKKIAEFNKAIDIQSNMEFTENNIRAFIIQLIGSYENILRGAVEEIFDEMSHKHYYDETSGNVHYFNGWKTNKAHYVNKKVILPIGNSYYSNPFYGYGGNLSLDGSAARRLNDIDVVMNYFTGDKEFLTISKAVDQAFAKGQTSGIESQYFKIACYKKGTIHLTFKDKDLLRRFNIEACKEKKWLPKGYGEKPYEEMSLEEKQVVEAFEGMENYNKHLNQVGFVNKNTVQISLN